MRYAFASDFDRTLFFRDRENHFRNGDLEAVTAYRKAGGLFGVCTGRSLFNLRWSLSAEFPLDFYILCGGSLILDSEEKELYSDFLPGDAVSSIGERCSGRTDVLAIIGNSRESASDITLYNGDSAALRVNSISIRTESRDTAERLCAEINLRLSGTVSAFVNEFFVDVVPFGCGKGPGIRKVKELLGIDHISAIGDSFNDLSMLLEADRSYTFRGSPEAVKEQADLLVDSVAEALRDAGNAVPR